MDNNYLIEKNDRIVHVQDEVIIENKGKRYLATFEGINDEDNAILKLSESGKYVVIDRNQAKKHLRINESNNVINELNILDIGKQSFKNIANDIISEDKSSLKPDYKINELVSNGININESTDRFERRKADIKKMKKYLMNANLIAEKYDINLKSLLSENDESEIELYAVDVRNMQDAIHRLITFEKEKDAEKAEKYIKELASVKPGDMDEFEYEVYSQSIMDEITNLKSFNDIIEINFREIEDDNTYGGYIDIINYNSYDVWVI